jgi:TolA-binding protein
MRRIRLTVAAALGCAALALTPATALATEPPLQNCENSPTNSLSHQYTVQQLQHALQTMPTTIAQYSNCEQVIQNQLDRQLSAQHHHQGGKGTNPTSVGADSAWPIVAVVVVVVIVAGGGFLFWRRRAGGGES